MLVNGLETLVFGGWLEGLEGDVVGDAVRGGAASTGCAPLDVSAAGFSMEAQGTGAFVSINFEVSRK